MSTTHSLSVTTPRRRKSRPQLWHYDLVKATHLIRRMPGESRSVLARCSDGLYYIIKFAGNPKGPNSLGNEVLGYQLADALNLRTPQFKMVKVSSRSLYDSPADWFSGYHDGFHPTAGFHLAIPFLGTPEALNTTETVPSWNYLIWKRRNDFLGMLLLDIWANAQAARQVVFAPGENGGTAPYFIDFGSMFGGPEGIFDDGKFAGLYFDARFYAPELRSYPMEYWVDTITRNASDVLSYGYREMPPEWYGTSYGDVRRALRLRLPKLLGLARTLLSP